MRIDSETTRIPPSDAARLQKHATEFEGILLGEMLGKLQHTFVSTGDSATPDPASDTISSLGTQALAQALAARNVLGIGSLVTKQLSGNSTAVTAPAVITPATHADVFNSAEIFAVQPKVAQVSADVQDERGKRLL